MADLFENPIGLDGFEFLEFTAPKKGMLEPNQKTWNYGVKATSIY